MMADYDFLLADEWDDFSGSCDCPTAPRQFLIPPPPPPPAMGVCGGAPLGDTVGGRGGGYFCHLEPMGAEFTHAGFPSLPVIAVCSSVVLVAVLVASFLLWRHKTKVQNLLPCKHDPNQATGHCGGTGPNGVTYEDVLINHHPTRLPITSGNAAIVGGQTLMPIELLDVKLGDIVQQDPGVLHPGSFYPCRDAPVRLVKAFHHPVYEEIPRGHPTKSINGKSYDSDVDGSARGGGRSFTSEDEFAEDELSGLEYPSGECSSRHCSATSSVQGSTGGDLCRDPASSDDGNGDDAEPFHGQGLPVLLPDLDYSTRKLGRLSELNPVPKIYHPTAGLPGDRSAKPFLVASRGGMVPQGNPQWCATPIIAMCPTAPCESVENIYSTIDDGEMMDNVKSINRHVGPTVTPSRGPTQSSAHSSKRIATKNQGNNQMSQRNDESESEPYGDIMPAYNAAPCPI